MQKKSRYLYKNKKKGKKGKAEVLSLLKDNINY